MILATLILICFSDRNKVKAPIDHVRSGYEY